MPALRLEPLPRERIDDFLELTRRVYGAEGMTGWHPQHVEAHLDRFPDGQLVASINGRLVASSTSFRTTRQRALDAHTWMSITGGAGLPAHDPDGDVLYGLEIAVDPHAQGLGLAKLVYRGRKVLARRLGCSAIVLGGRMAGWEDAREDEPDLTPRTYVQDVAEGRREDPVIGLQLDAGFEPRGVLENYVRDRAAGHHAALMVWEP